jgi:hypothetical protein
MEEEKVKVVIELKKECIQSSLFLMKKNCQMIYGKS